MSKHPSNGRLLECRLQIHGENGLYTRAACQKQDIFVDQLDNQKIWLKNMHVSSDKSVLRGTDGRCVFHCETCKAVRIQKLPMGPCYKGSTDYPSVCPSVGLSQGLYLLNRHSETLAKKKTASNSSAEKKKNTFSQLALQGIPRLTKCHSGHGMNKLPKRSSGIPSRTGHPAGAAADRIQIAPVHPIGTSFLFFLGISSIS
ncbi:hypothetical protein EVAR_24637_1 [Eumeta japonica]|uniref:Uncharacterized protein n=1 Tax=Eumeta variegata TaxID=151549 RepID=A0A4C1V135_EUMVA|nr:hypothetical protein EVAR_24637_1 [Eumeta japonica]